MAEDNQTTIGTGDAGDQHLDNQGGVTPAWAAQLPSDLRSNETLTGHKTIGELGKAYLDLHGKSATLSKYQGKTPLMRIGRPSIKGWEGPTNPTATSLKK